jgi:N-acetylmuramoyl-L-alanine amidase
MSSPFFLQLLPVCRHILAFLLLLPGVLLAAPAASVLTASPDAPIIVLDPGHGGHNIGARAKQPFCEEKRLCLQTARLVKQYLDQLGYRVLLTRSTDAFIGLPRRVEIARQADCSLFVSIHYNSSRNPTAKGIEIFYCDNEQPKGSASKRLASAVLQRILRRVPLHSRGVKKGNFYVIRETDMPAILIEGGFISNPQERALLKSPEFQTKLARGIADGIDHYLKKKK